MKLILSIYKFKIILMMLCSFSMTIFAAENLATYLEKNKAKGVKPFELWNKSGSTIGVTLRQYSNAQAKNLVEEKLLPNKKLAVPIDINIPTSLEISDLGQQGSKYF